MWIKTNKKIIITNIINFMFLLIKFDFSLNRSSVQHKNKLAFLKLFSLRIYSSFKNSVNFLFKDFPKLLRL